METSTQNSATFTVTVTLDHPAKRRATVRVSDGIDWHGQEALRQEGRQGSGASGGVMSPQSAFGTGNAMHHLVAVVATGGGTDAGAIVKDAFMAALCEAAILGSPDILVPLLGTENGGPLTAKESATLIAAALREYVQRGGAPIDLTIAASPKTFVALGRTLEDGTFDLGRFNGAMVDPASRLQEGWTQYDRAIALFRGGSVSAGENRLKAALEQFSNLGPALSPNPDIRDDAAIGRLAAAAMGGDEPAAREHFLTLSERVLKAAKETGVRIARKIADLGAFTFREPVLQERSSRLNQAASSLSSQLSLRERAVNGAHSGEQVRVLQSAPGEMTLVG